MFCYETETYSCSGVNKDGCTWGSDSHISLNIGVHGEYGFMMAGSLGYKLTLSHSSVEVPCPIHDAAHINYTLVGVHCGHGVI